jgi:hypothetical protein
MNPSFKTPLRLAATGLIILAAFLILHALGWRSHTSFFSGTVSDQGSSAAKALAYAALYFLAWFVAPVYFLAALIHLILFKPEKNSAKKSLEFQKSPDILPPSQTT